MSQFNVYIFRTIIIHSKEGCGAAACQQTCMPDCAGDQICIGKVFVLVQGNPSHPESESDFDECYFFDRFLGGEAEVKPASL